MMQKNIIPMLAMLSALAIIFAYVESLLPIIVTIPGIKLGISNIVILFALCFLNRRSAFLIMLVKVLVSSLLFSGMNTFLYSLGGGALSFCVMAIFISGKGSTTVNAQKNSANSLGGSRFANLSVIGISMLGGVFHNLGQLAVAAFMLSTASVFYYLPFLLISGIGLGAVTGTVCKIVLARLSAVRLQD